MPKQPTAVDSFPQQFAKVKFDLPGSGLAWLDDRREAGIETFNALGLPTPRLEAWKYTRLQSLEDTQFRSARADDANTVVDLIPAVLPADPERPRLVFVNGFLRRDLSMTGGLPDGATVECLTETLERDTGWVETHMGGAIENDEHALLALNTAMMSSGVVIHIRPDVIVSKPIEILFMTGLTDVPVAYHPRNLIVMDEGSQATLVKHYVGAGVGAYLTNTVTEISVGPGAVLHHYRVQEEDLGATHLKSEHVRIGRDGTYDSFALAIGGRLSRTETFARLEGEGSHCQLNGAYMMRGREHCDNTTVIEHMVPNTTCREVFKGVLNDEARAVFQGRIVVHKDAQHTDGYQLSKALLLSDRAEMDAKPELEIYADDVKCSHGATTGQIDEASLFYLRSRGIPQALARNLLIQSFLGEALDEISSTEVRKAMMDKIVHWLPAHCFLADEWRDG